jgi:acyl-CoA dehydrogenase
LNGEEQACFGVTEPDVGLDIPSTKTFATRVQDGYRVSGRKMSTSTRQVAHKIHLLTRTTPKDRCKRPTDGMALFYTDLDRSKVEVRRIHKMGRNVVESNAVFIDGIFIRDEDRIGEEGAAFRYILDSLNPERMLVASEAIGLGWDALARAARYAKERVVFERPSGQNQGLQHSLAASWMILESAYWMVMRACWLYDNKRLCGAEANTAKYLAAKAAFDACTRAVTTHGGMGYAQAYQVEDSFVNRCSRALHR